MSLSSLLNRYSPLRVPLSLAWVLLFVCFVFFNPRIIFIFFSLWQKSSLSKANQGWDSGVWGGGGWRRRWVLTERFGQMDRPTGCALSAQADMMRRDRRMEEQNWRKKWSGESKDEEPTAEVKLHTVTH